MSLEITGPGHSSAVTPAKVSGTADNSLFAGILKSSSEKYGVDLDKLFAAASEKYKVPLNLLKAVAKAESDFNPNATSPKGAMGIMQLMPGTAAELGVTDGYDPEQNIMGGAKYLGQMLQQFNGDIRLAAAGYNAGPDAVERYGGIPPYDETQNYVRTVMGYLGDSITAGTVMAGGRRGLPPSDGLYQLSNPSQLGSLLENSLLSGGFGGSLADLLSSIGSTDPKDISNKIMASVYTLQLQMLQGGANDGNSVIV